ncbi:30S ribosomal protein S8 [Wolbachia endosymbiont of Armadillidium vulgare str. wVulC]|uniref:Small ribosomal subunit protein uS8 n=1 Tax=Wolbachia endosymbiont of Armadillidium arcangelii TaxID=3158571 RepID=A0AAU7Q2X7_9RICK|nr:30S ribosomal protein S8 [Wolbachia endosymbiont of Armadillidium vulgare]KLT23228.1 30S ribosomal protein S8 [Wolbachia endosymbiont of Armadillidium vulgare str. wVulC]OJH30368.1 30S ribosomal protein S8 [Armadillidium vulgare] [Wolbachia endosymbiont of Armadillidium vulgare]OJH30813.1 30S ribosomal protein S8 [Wolbachia endosymbiont of Armadillidium vulgare]OJH31852.1 30S ribosomal protein S8 [Wolbachia endosymbiont of Armadillidium vulgare]
MALSDSIGDFLTRIRNAQLAVHRTTIVLFSKLNSSILKILKDEGYILDYQKEVIGNIPSFIVKLKYYEKSSVISDIIRVSKPGCRFYSKYKDISKAYNGLGIFIISTSKGVMTDYNARKLKVGGEVLCRVF